MSPENEARMRCAMVLIAQEEADAQAIEPVLYTLEPISIDDAAHELARAEGRLKSALTRLRNCGAVDRNVRNDVTREVSRARTEALLSAWRLRALRAEAG